MTVGNVGKRHNAAVHRGLAVGEVGEQCLPRHGDGGENKISIFIEIYVAVCVFLHYFRHRDLEDFLVVKHHHQQPLLFLARGKRHGEHAVRVIVGLAVLNGPFEGVVRLEIQIPRRFDISFLPVMEHIGTPC